MGPLERICKEIDSKDTSKDHLPLTRGEFKEILSELMDDMTDSMLALCSRVETLESICGDFIYDSDEVN